MSDSNSLDKSGGNSSADRLSTYLGAIRQRIYKLENRAQVHEQTIQDLKSKQVESHHAVLNKIAETENNLVHMIHVHIQENLSRYMTLVDEIKSIKLSIGSIQAKLIGGGIVVGGMLMVLEMYSTFKDLG